MIVMRDEVKMAVMRDEVKMALMREAKNYTRMSRLRGMMAALYIVNLDIEWLT